jgi:hypothetical protein
MIQLDLKRGDKWPLSYCSAFLWMVVFFFESETIFHNSRIFLVSSFEAINWRLRSHWRKRQLKIIKIRHKTKPSKITISHAKFQIQKILVGKSE